eukprot:635262-Pyramimonas_sp.AAC.1
MDLVHDVREPALEDCRAAASAGPTAEHRQRRDEILLKRRTLGRNCFTGEDRMAIRPCDRRIRRERCRLDREDVDRVLREAQHAADRGHSSTAWKLAFQVGAIYHGVRRRRFNALSHYLPTPDEWTDTMQAGAREG